MSFPSKYVVDAEAIKLLAYRLLSLFYANKEIARRSDPDAPQDNAARLEQKFFFAEVSKLLLEIAISLRVLDDQIQGLPDSSDLRNQYIRRRESLDMLSCALFDKFSFREICNKIIHASTVEPHFQEGSESHQIDHYNWAGWSEAMAQSDESLPQPDPIKWRHLSCTVRLGGRKGREEWWVLLQIPEFVDTLCELLQ